MATEVAMHGCMEYPCPVCLGHQVQVYKEKHGYCICGMPPMTPHFCTGKPSPSVKWEYAEREPDTVES